MFKHKAHGRPKLSDFSPDLKMRGLPKPKRFSAVEKSGGEGHHHEAQYMVYQNLQTTRDYAKKILKSLEEGAGAFPAWLNHKLSVAQTHMKDVTHWLRYEGSRGRRFGGTSWYGRAGIEPGGRGGFAFAATDEVSPHTSMYVAKSNLRHLKNYASEACNQLEINSGTLPQWAEHKLSIVAETLDCVGHFVENEMKEGRRYGRVGGGSRRAGGRSGRGRGAGKVRRAGPRRPGRRRARRGVSRRHPRGRIPRRRNFFFYPQIPQPIYQETVVLAPQEEEVLRIDGYPFYPELGTVVMPLNVLKSSDTQLNGKIVQVMRHSLHEGQAIALSRLPTGEMVWLPTVRGQNA